MSLSAGFALLRAEDVDAAMAAVGRIETSWNWVLADAAGNIGYQMSGLMPLRRDGGQSGIFSKSPQRQAQRPARPRRP